MGRIRDFVGGAVGISRFSHKPRKGYSTLFHSWESFFTRRLYRRLQDCWGRPISSAPGAVIHVMSRQHASNGFTLEADGQATECINLGSYNYLGFGDDWKTSCKAEVMKELGNFPVSMCSSRMDVGNLRLHEELEELVANFLNKEAALVYGMGYDTNTATIPALMGSESLIVSDSLNHTSIVNGARNSASNIRVFRHNDPSHLEDVLREAIVRGQPKHHRPWKKILVMVEGIYSMEGDICRLPEIVRICKKYKCYIYVDEAHSIGALGKTGRGVCEHTGVDTKDIGKWACEMWVGVQLVTRCVCDCVVNGMWCRYSDGYVHEVVQRHGRIHRRVGGGDSLFEGECIGRVVPQCDGSDDLPAGDHGVQGDYGTGRHGSGCGEVECVAREQQLLPLGDETYRASCGRRR